MANKPSGKEEREILSLSSPPLASSRENISFLLLKKKAPPKPLDYLPLWALIGLNPPRMKGVIWPLRFAFVQRFSLKNNDGMQGRMTYDGEEGTHEYVCPRLSKRTTSVQVRLYPGALTIIAFFELRRDDNPVRRYPGSVQLVLKCLTKPFCSVKDPVSADQILFTGEGRI